MTVEVEAGRPAPDFDLATDFGERVSLSSLRGKPIGPKFSMAATQHGPAHLPPPASSTWADGLPFERSGLLDVH